MKALKNLSILPDSKSASISFVMFLTSVGDITVFCAADTVFIVEDITSFINALIGQITIQQPNWSTDGNWKHSDFPPPVGNKPRVLTLDAIHTAQTGNKVVPSSLAREELGHKPRPIEETIYDTIEFFQKRGLVK